jgi:hypothetical protein
VPDKTLCPSDLALLAARAAVELDDLLLERSTNVASVVSLGEHLQSRLQVKENGPVSMQLMDPTTVVMVSSAMTASLGAAVSTVEELVTRAKEMTTDVKAGADDRGRLEKVRAFCVALSRVADAYGPAIDEADARHPYSS